MSDVEVLTLPVSLLAETNRVVESTASRAKDFSVVIVGVAFLLPFSAFLLFCSMQPDGSGTASMLLFLALTNVLGVIGVWRVFLAYRQSLDAKVVVGDSGVLFKNGAESLELRWSDVKKTSRLRDIDLVSAGTETFVTNLVIGAIKIRFNLSDLKKNQLGFINNWELRRHILLMLAVKCPGLLFEREIFIRAGIDPCSWKMDRVSRVIYYGVLTAIPAGLMVSISSVPLGIKWILCAVGLYLLCIGALLVYLEKSFSLFSRKPIQFVKAH